MDSQDPGKRDQQKNSPIAKHNLFDYFTSNQKTDSLLSPTIKLTPVQSQEKIPNPKAKSAIIKGKKGTMYELTSINEMRSTKGKNEYLVQWVSHDPTWESQKLLEEDIKELIEQFNEKH